MGLIIVGSVAVASFLIATLYTQVRLSELDTAAIKIEKIASPSLSYLTNTKEKLDELSQILNASDPQANEIIQARIDSIRRATQEYLKLDLLPGEEALWSKVSSTLADLQRAIDSLHNGSERKLSARIRDTYDAIERAKNAIFDTIQYDLKVSSQLADEIVRVRRETASITLLLDALALLLSAVAVMLVYRVFHRHNLLVETKNQLLQDRVTELDRFSGRVAHDLKNPLATIESALELLTSEGKGTPDLDLVQMARRNAERATRLVDDLLVFAKAGGKPSPGGNANIAAVTERVSELYAPQASAKQISLNLPCSPDIQVACSEGVLFSIVGNLVGNAINHMGTSDIRKITMATEVYKDKVRLSICDTGPGIPSDLQARVFEPFERLGAQGEGFGLGLATVKRLTESHGGSVGVESEPGKGCSFWVSLPIAKVPASSASLVSNQAAQTA
ncbi:MAG: HAMP domain-containing sensor histidine kinase [Bdellovibrionota bacterium]